MDIDWIMKETQKLRQELEQIGQAARAEAIGTMVRDRHSASESLRSLRFVLQMLLRGNPPLKADMNERVSRLLAEIEDMMVQMKYPPPPPKPPPA